MTPSRTPPPARSRLLRAVKVVVSVSLLGLLAWIVDWDAAASVASRADPLGLALVPVIWLGSDVVAALRWRLVLRACGTRYSLLRCTLGYLTGTLYSLLLPGAVGGDAARVALVVRDTDCAPGTAAASVVLERVAGALGLVGLILAVFVLSPATIARLLRGGSPDALFGFGLALLASGPLFYLAARRWLPRGDPSSGGVRGFVASARAALDLVSPGHAALALALSLAFQSVRFGAVALFAAALGLDLSLAAVFVVFPLVSLAAIVPVSLGGLGVREATAVALLAPFGLDAGPAALLGFSIYVNEVIVAVLGGVVQLLRSARSGP